MIVCCGEALIDMVPRETDPGTFQARAGGCPLNTAVAAARLGARAAFLGRISADFLGDRLARTLEENGVDCRFLVRTAQPTTLAFVERGGEGERYAFYSSGAADRSLSPGDLPSRLGADASFLMVGSISLLQEPAGSTIEGLVMHEAGRAVSLDPNIRPSLVEDRVPYLQRLLRIASASVIVKISAEDLQWMFPDADEEEGVSRLLSMGPELIVVTRGSEGARACTKNEDVSVPAPHVVVADTIGAGDSFHGALLYSLEADGRVSREGIAGLDSGRLRRMLEFSATAAALTCTKPGADPPRLEEVKDFIRGRAG